jgi:hypothetical protein
MMATAAEKWVIGWTKMGSMMVKLDNLTCRLCSNRRFRRNGLEETLFEPAPVAEVHLWEI